MLLLQDEFGIYQATPLLSLAANSSFGFQPKFHAIANLGVPPVPISRKPGVRTSFSEIGIFMGVLAGKLRAAVLRPTHERRRQRDCACRDDVMRGHGFRAPFLDPKLTRRNSISGTEPDAQARLGTSPLQSLDSMPDAIQLGLHARQQATSSTRLFKIIAILLVRLCPTALARRDQFPDVVYTGATTSTRSVEIIGIFLYAYARPRWRVGRQYPDLAYASKRILSGRASS